MKQTRALGPDFATFTCAWLYQSLFSLRNDAPLGSFHHLPPSLPSSRLCCWQGHALWRDDGEACPHLGKSLSSHCHLAKSTSSALFVTQVTQEYPVQPQQGYFFPPLGKWSTQTTLLLNIAESLSWLQAIKLSMQMRTQIAYLLSSGWAVNWKDQALSLKDQGGAEAEERAMNWPLHLLELACSLSSLVWKQCFNPVCLGGLLYLWQITLQWRWAAGQRAKQYFILELKHFHKGKITNLPWLPCCLWGGHAAPLGLQITQGTTALLSLSSGDHGDCSGKRKGNCIILLYSQPWGKWLC